MAKSISKLKDQARAHEQKEEWEKAAQLYQQVLRAAEEEGDIAPELPLFNRIGDIYLRLGRPQDAVTFFEQAADHYEADGLFNNAIALCNKALRHTPGRLELYHKLGRLSANQGFASDARRYFLEYAERNLKQGALDEAFNALAELAELTDDPEIRELLARQLHAHGRSQAAVDELRRAYTGRMRAGDRAGADAVREAVRAIDAGAAETLDEASTEAPAEAGPLTGLPLLEEPEYAPVPEPEAEPVAEPPQRAAAPPPPMPKLIETERSAAEAELEQQRLAERAATDAERAAAEAAVAAAIAAADEAVAEAEAVEKAAEKVKDERAAAAARLQGFDPTLLGDVSSAASAVITPGLERPVEVAPDEVAPLPLLDLLPSTAELAAEQLPPLPLPLIDLEEEVVAPPPAVPGLTIGPLEGIGMAEAEPEALLATPPVAEEVAPAEPGLPTLTEAELPTFAEPEVVEVAPPVAELPTLPEPEAAAIAPPEPELPTFVELEAAAVAPPAPELPTFVEPEAAAVAPPEAELPTFVEPEAAAAAPPEAELPGFVEPEPAVLAPVEAEAPAAQAEGPVVAPDVDADVAAAADRLKAASARLEAQLGPPPALIPFEEAEGTLAPEVAPGAAPPAPEEPPAELSLEELVAQLPPAPEPPPVQKLSLEQLIADTPDTRAPPSEPLRLRDLILEEPPEAAPPAAPAQPEEMSLRDLILEEEPPAGEPPAQPGPREMNLRDLILEEPAVEPPATGTPPAEKPPGAARPPLEEEPFDFFGEGAVPRNWRERKEEPPADEAEPWTAPEEEAPWAPPEEEEPWAPPPEPEPWAATHEEEPWTAPAEPVAPPPAPEPAAPEPAAPPAGREATPADASGDPVVLLARSLYAHGQPAAGRAALEQLLADAERAGNAPRMLEVLEALADVEPDDVEIHQRRVDVCIGVKGPRAAVAALLGLAGALERSGQGVRASAAYQQVLDIDPSNATAGAALRKEREARPRKQDASGFVDLGQMLLAEEPPPTEPTTRFVVAETAPTGDEERDFVEMLEQFKEKVAEHMGEDPVAHYDLGLAYKEMGLLDEAVAEFQIALRNGQDRLKVLEELGRCFMLKDEPRIALRLLGQALAVPDRAEVEYMGVNYLLGRCYEAVGELDAARDAYERVVGLDIQFNDVAERLARL